MHSLRRNLFALMVSITCASTSVRAQDVETILNDAMKASGGAAKLRKVTTLSIEGTAVRASDSKSGVYTLRLKSSLTTANPPGAKTQKVKSVRSLAPRRFKSKHWRHWQTLVFSTARKIKS